MSVIRPNLRVAVFVERFAESDIPAQLYILKFHRMRLSNRHLEQKAVDLCDIQPDHDVLEVGFGGGEGLKYAAKQVRGGSGKIFGIDISNVCVQHASSKFKRLIRKDKIDVSLGTVGNLPYEPNTFHSAFHVNTFFFWSNMSLACSELYRVLRPGSKLVSVVDLKHYSVLKKKNLLPMMSVDPINYMFSLEAAGFTDVRVEYFEERGVEYPAFLASVEPDLKVELE
ncbi:hypothetical protein CAPTEDRAFT_204823 [Capitella teleta]|uniref:Methyltransferase type 11 domain-containing protein n=1 Tax=Capitella teleta TaxID=283909 RepID=R7UD84_CAPTE|nr:hypothetical protein CAPTEDRAFT_204823 [Capitella teleta]|eukprot:ELU01232.1 hypothetical protein CAPTEDRAFT_204823 [Capitella teleta]